MTIRDKIKQSDYNKGPIYSRRNSITIVPINCHTKESSHFVAKDMRYNPVTIGVSYFDNPLICNVRFALDKNIRMSIFRDYDRYCRKPDTLESRNIGYMRTIRAKANMRKPRYKSYNGIVSS